MAIKFLTVIILCIPLTLSTPLIGQERFKDVKRSPNQYKAETEDLGVSSRLSNRTDLLLSPNNTKNPTIYGGFNAPQETANFMAIVLTRKGTSSFSYCSGAVITRNQIITNAHCFFKKGTFLVAVTDVYIGVGLGNGEFLNASNRLSVREVHILPTYNRDPNRNDIAVVTLRSHLPRSQNISRYSRKTLRGGQKVRVAGYGRTEDLGRLDTDDIVLRESSLSFLGMSTCKRRTKITSKTSFGSRCFVSPWSGSSATSGCSGDSGAPIFYIHKRSARMYIYALHTYRDGKCGGEDTISVGMKLKSYGQYIDDIKKGNYSAWDEVYPDNKSNFDSA